MKVFHLIKTSEGAAWAIGLLKALKKQYPNYTFVVALPLGGQFYNSYLEVCDKVYEFEYKIGLRLFTNGLKLKKIVKKENPDIIHSWFVQTTLYARLFLRNIKTPRIFQVVGPAHLENTLFKWADVLSAQKQDCWVATSQYIFNKYKACRIPESKLSLNYAFIDTQALINSKKHIKPRDFRKELNLAEGTKIVGTASYIYPPKFYERTGIKGHEYLLNSFEKLLKKRHDVVLVIAGSTFGNKLSYENKLKQKAEQISPDKIFFTGKFSHIGEVICNFNAFVYLSKSENLGGVYESLFYEIPTVASNKGALPELVIDNETGYCVSPQDTSAVANRIERVLNSDNNEFKIEGKALVLNTFDNKTIIETAHMIYQSISGRNNGETL